MKAQTEVSDPDQKHLLEEILGSVREIKAEAAARHLRKATKQHCFSELLAVVQAEPTLVESAVRSATSGNPVVLCTAVYTHQERQLQALKSKLEEQTALAEDAASKLLEQEAVHNSILSDAQQQYIWLRALKSSLEDPTTLAEEAASKLLVQKVLGLEMEKTAAAVERADSLQAQSATWMGELQGLKSSLTEQTAVAEQAASKLWEQEAVHNSIMGDAQQALGLEMSKAAAASVRADSHQAECASLHQKLQALRSSLEEQRGLAEEAASKLLVQKVLYNCILGDAQQVLGFERSKLAAAAVRADSHQAECATLHQKLQEVLADKSAMADGHQLSQKDHDVVIEKEKQAVLLEEGARRTVKETLLRLKAAETEITDLTEQLQAEKGSASQACAAATKEAELLSGKADRQLSVSKELQTDMQVLRKEKKANRKERKAMRKQMEKRENKQQIAEMEASKLPVVQAAAVASLQQELAAAQQAAATATAAEKKAAAEAAHVKERFEVEVEMRNKALAKIVRLEAKLARIDQAGAEHGSNTPLLAAPQEIEDQQEVESKDEEAKDMAAATAASLESVHSGAFSSKCCEVCGVAPHPVEDCPLVKRVSAGVEETAQAKKEEGEWQQVKAAPGKAPKQPEGHKGKGNIQGQGKGKGNTQGQGKGKGKQAGQQGGKGQMGAGRVLTVPRGKPIARPATPQSPQAGPHPPRLPSTTSPSHSESARPNSRRGMTYADVMVRSNASPNPSGPAPDPRAGSR